MIRLNPPAISKNSIDDVTEVLKDGRLNAAYESFRLETKLKQYLNVDNVIACSSGTSALEILLAACGVGRGDEVITSPFTFKATHNAIRRVGATPVFAPLDRTWRIDERAIEYITRRTRAIIPVHLYGAPVHMDAFRSLRIPVIEDACQALGSSYMGSFAGNLGYAGAFSFYGSKIIGAGEGGCITTNDFDLAVRCRKLINHGTNTTTAGTNARISELSAALLLDQVDDLNTRIYRRQQHAAMYNAAGLYNPQYLDDKISHNFHLYTVRVKSHKRPALQNALDKAKIEWGVYYSVKDIQQVHQISDEVLSIPVHQNLAINEVEKIIDVCLSVPDAIGWIE